MAKAKAKVKKEHIVTQEDLDQNPDLLSQGIQVGDKIELPENTDAKDATKDDIADDVNSSDAPGGEVQKNVNGVYTVNRNVKFKGKYYKLGDKVRGDSDAGELFLKMGYMQ